MKHTPIILLLFALCIAFATPVAAVKWTAYKICIDPGHGGSDPGASGPSAPHEAELVLRCGLALRTKLQSFGAPVGMTRTTNTTVSLTARKNYFLNQNPYIALSIHLNAFNKTAHGTETWYYWESGNSKSLANKMQKALVSQLKRSDRGVKKYGWTVITASSTIPSVLTEGLFVDNYTEWDMLNSTTKSGFQSWVNGHLYGCYDHLVTMNANLDNPRSNTPTPTISVTPTSLSFSCPSNKTKTANFTVTGKELSANISVTSNSPNFTVNTTSLGKTGGSVTVTFKPSEATTYSGKITVNSGSVSKTISLTGTGTFFTDLALTQKWNVSEQKGNVTAKGWDASKVRNMTYGYNGKLYLIYEHTKVKVVMSQSGKELYDLPNTGVGGGTLALCDVIHFNGKIIACNLGTDTSPIKIYVWDSDTSEPRVLLETTKLGGTTRLGDCIGVTGTWKDGKLVFANDDGTTTRIVSYAITNGVCSKTPTVIKATTDGTNQLACSSSIRVQPDATGYWINGKHNALTRLDASGKKLYEVSQSNTFGNGFSAFTYKDINYAALTTFNGTANYTGGCIELVEASKGWKNTAVLGVYPSAGLGTTPNTNCTGDCFASSDGNNVEVWVLSTGQGIAYYAHGSPYVYVEEEMISSVNSVDSDKSFSISLTNNILTVKDMDVSQINIYSLTGQKVLSSRENHVPLHVNRGIYVVVVSDVDGNIRRKKILVK